MITAMAAEQEIRTARAGDSDELTDLHRRASMVYEDEREVLAAHPEIWGVAAETIAGGHVRVLTRGGRIIGFATVIPEADVAGELDDLFVDPDAWRQGLGRLLIDDAVAIARARGLRVLQVTANLHARGFYERLGFVGDGEVVVQFGVGLRMHRDVPGQP